ncbi:hypothetical protein Daus18300_012433 [Diaporthe australafricana]|uniref:Protein kinase domain-containing protein n=1 Tax=Diaporthe australafricana TaxID=127596 RepID=A0ABR3W2V2_9PEZI
MDDDTRDRRYATHLLQRSIDYFDHWRIGRLHHWNDTEREAVYSAWNPLPVFQFPREDPAIVARNATIPARQYRPFSQIRRIDDGAGRTVNPALRARFEDIGWRMVKILGAGSQGLAVLFESMDNGPQRRFVFKWSSDIKDANLEMWCMRQMLGARHIVQGLARRISERSVKLKNSELWRIFLCFFRACVGLGYPNRWDGGLNARTQDVPTQEEFVPRMGGQAVPADMGLVDFDINERNVMIGEDSGNAANGAHAHDVVPIFKIGDLGFMGAWREPRYVYSFRSRVAFRVAGNPICNTPEQFTQTWNNHAPENWNAFAQDDTAGKYGWWTNLWQIGRLMTIIITQNQPQVPPDCVWADVTVADGTQRNIPTYGAPLLFNNDLSHYDPLLLNTICWCMAHRPGDRPRMLELEQRITRQVNRDWSGEDVTDRVTIRDLLIQPPAPRATAAPYGLWEEHCAI